MSAAVSPPVLYVSNTAAGGAYTLAGAAITGATTLIKTGDGALTLTGANTYTGLTDVQGGELIFQNANAVPTGATIRLHGGGAVNCVTRYSTTGRFFEIADDATLSNPALYITTNWDDGNGPIFTGDGVVALRTDPSIGTKSWVPWFMTNGSPDFTGTLLVDTAKYFSLVGDWGNTTVRFSVPSASSQLRLYNTTSGLTVRLDTVTFAGEGAISRDNSNTYYLDVGTVRRENTASNGTNTIIQDLGYISSTHPYEGTDIPALTGKNTLVFDNQDPDPTGGIQVKTLLKSANTGNPTNIVKTGAGWLFITDRGNGSTRTYSTENTLGGGTFYILEGGVVFGSTSITPSVVQTGMRNVWDGRDKIILGENATAILANYTWQNDSGGATNPVGQIIAGRGSIVESYSLNFLGDDSVLAGGTFYGHGNAWNGNWGNWVFRTTLTVSAVNPVTGTDYINPVTNQPYTKDDPLVSTLLTTTGGTDYIHFGLYNLANTAGGFRINIAPNARLNVTANVANDIYNDSASMSGATRVIVDGGGTVDFQGVMRFTGGVLVEGGSTVILSGNNSNVSHAYTVNAGGALEIAMPPAVNPFAVTASQQINAASQIVLNDDGELRFNRTDAAGYSFANPVTGTGAVRNTGTATTKPTNLTATFTGGVFADKGTLDLTTVTGGWTGTVTRFGTGDTGSLLLPAAGLAVSLTAASNRASYAGHTPSVTRTDITGSVTLANTQRLYIGADGLLAGTGADPSVTTDAPAVATLTIAGSLNIADAQLCFDLAPDGSASDLLRITGAAANLTISTATPLHFASGSATALPSGEYKLIEVPAGSAAAATLVNALAANLLRLGEINGVQYDPDAIDAPDADPNASRLTLRAVTDSVANTTALLLTAVPASAVVYWNRNGTGGIGGTENADGASALITGQEAGLKIWYSETYHRHFGASDGFTFVFDKNRTNPDTGVNYPGPGTGNSALAVPVESAVAALGVRLNTGALTLENVTTSSGGGALTAFARGTVFDVGRKNYTDHDSNP
ncbi:MAG: autotransporter-associated beta strand repeat-containing protein, partial [Puniceicoccales bacterium]|nr:autotransporter-associated beta strand repeat-containing protein [Puniceicoccales bacterium]